MSRQYVHCSVSLSIRPSLAGAGRGEEKQERKVCLSSLSSLGFSLLSSPFTLRNASVSRRYVAFMLSLYVYVVFLASSPREIIKSLIAG